MAHAQRKQRNQITTNAAPNSTPKEFERTLAIIKPNAVSKIKTIESLIEKAGLFILSRRRIFLKPEQARDFYLHFKEDEDTAKYYKLYAEMLKKTNDKDRNEVPPMDFIVGEDPESNFKIEEFVDFMTSGPIEILVIAGRGTVQKWLKIMGPEHPKIARETHPESLRAQFGGETVLRNAVYGSESVSRAEKEIKYFFPESKFELENKIGTSGEYLSKTVNPILLKGLIQLCRQKPDNPLVWLADWLLANNPHTKP